MPNKNAVVVGAVSGATEVMVNHPLWVLKTRYQDPRVLRADKLTANPRVLYRGLLPNMLSMMPITSLQVGVNYSLNQWLNNQLVNACTAGAVSASVSGPVEYLMSQQTATCGFAKTAQKVYQTNGLRGFGRGLAGTAVRDAAFSGGYLYGAKSLKDFYTQYMSPPKATLAGGVSAGLLAAAVSQPADTLKTMQQSSQSKTVTPLWALAQKNLYRARLKRVLCGQHAPFSQGGIGGYLNEHSKRKA